MITMLVRLFAPLKLILIPEEIILPGLDRSKHRK